MSGIDKSVINPIYGTKTIAGTIPANTTKTGTISSTGARVTGTSTLFKTFSQVRKGDFIFSQNQVRRVEAIYSDTIIGINAAFVPDLSAVAFKVIRHLPDVKVSILNTGGAVAKISTMTSDDQDLGQGVEISYESNNSVGPIAYNPNGAILVVSNGEITGAGGVGTGASVQSGIVAHAGGGQALATILTAQLSRVDTVASAGDSVLAPSALVGSSCTIQNYGANAMDVFPKVGENFIGLADNVAISVVPGTELNLVCYTAGEWTPR